MFDLEKGQAGVYEGEVTGGVYDLCLRNLGPMFGWKKIWRDALEIAAGDILEKIVDLDQTSDVRLKIRLNGTPYAAHGIRVMICETGLGEYVRDLEETGPGQFEGALVAGLCDPEVTDRYYSSWLRDLGLTSGGFELATELTDDDFTMVIWNSGGLGQQELSVCSCWGIFLRAASATLAEKASFLHHAHIDQQFVAGADLQFLIDVPVVSFDGVYGKAQDSRNLMGCMSLDIEVKNSFFCRGKGCYLFLEFPK